jgi:hypothetical protein
MEEAVADFQKEIEDKQKEFSYWNGRLISL